MKKEDIGLEEIEVTKTSRGYEARILLRGKPEENLQRVKDLLLEMDTIYKGIQISIKERLAQAEILDG